MIYPGTYIYTKRGNIRCSEISVGDYVVSDRGRWTKVVKVDLAVKQCLYKLRTKKILYTDEITKYLSLSYAESRQAMTGKALFRNLSLLDRMYCVKSLGKNGYKWEQIRSIEYHPELAYTLFNLRLERDRGYYVNGI